MFTPAEIAKHTVKFHTPLRIPRTIGDQAIRDCTRSLFYHFDGTHIFHLNFNRHISDERATRLTGRFFGQLWRIYGIKLLTLGVLVQHKGGTHLHIFARDKEPSRYDGPEPKKKQVFLRDLSEIEWKRLEKLWQPFGRRITKGACIEAIRDLDSSLIYTTAEKNIPPGGTPILYLGRNRSVTTKIVKKCLEEWEAKLDLVAEEAECDAAFRTPAPVIPFPIPDRTVASSMSKPPFPVEPIDTETDISADALLRELNEVAGLTDTVRQLSDTVPQLFPDCDESPDTVRQLSDSERQLFPDDLLREIPAPVSKSERSTSPDCEDYEWYLDSYHGILKKLFEDTVKATFPLRQKQRYAALKTNERRRANREDTICRAILELSTQGERITRRRISSITSIPVPALSRPHYKHLFDPGLPPI